MIFCREQMDLEMWTLQQWSAITHSFIGRSAQNKCFKCPYLQIAWISVTTDQSRQASHCSWHLHNYIDQNIGHEKKVLNWINMNICFSYILSMTLTLTRLGVFLYFEASHIDPVFTTFRVLLMNSSLSVHVLGIRYFLNQWSAYQMWLKCRPWKCG